MKIRLNYWQCALLSLPFLVGNTLFVYANFKTYPILFALSNLLNVISLFAIVSYQAYLAISFNNALHNTWNLFKVNAMIPSIFFFAYIIEAIYLTFLKSHPHSPSITGPMQKADMNLTGIIIVVLLIHAVITFLFINNQFVSKRIKKIQDPSEQKLLKMDFLTPMRIIVRVSIYAFLLEFIILTVTDIIKFSGI